MDRDILFQCASEAGEAAQARWRQLGFRLGDKGTHTSRTMMLDELSTVLAHCPENAVRSDYAVEIVGNNLLGKRTASMRRLSNQRLGELYGLDPAIPLFRIFRFFWEHDGKGRPLLALLLALARDPLLRATVSPVVEMQVEKELPKGDVVEALRQAVGNRLNESSLDQVARNSRSTWCQSGHLEGRVRKIRKKVSPTLYVATYGLVLAYLTGGRGQTLFESPCLRVLDTAPADLMYLAMDAKRLGIIDMKTSGGLLHISFDALLTDGERRLVHGTY